jgi:deuterolysin
MKFLEILAVASLGRALSTKSIAGDSFLDVKLEMTGNTAVEATITNTGVTAIKLFKTGTILDDASVEKVKVYRGSTAINGTTLLDRI